MTLFKIALQHLHRSKGKTIFILVIYLMAIVTTLSLNQIAAAMQANLQTSLSQYGSNVIITPYTDHLNLSYGGIAIPGVNFDIKRLSDEDLTLIKQNSGEVTTIAPKIIGQASESDQTFLIIGVDFNKELAMKPWWKIEGTVPTSKEIVVGTTIAQKNKLQIGSKLNLNNNNYKVTGIMQETGGSEDNGIFADIPTARKLTGINADWSMIELNSAQPEETVAALTPLLKDAKVAPITQLVQSTKDNVDRFSYFSFLASLLLGLTGLFIISITMAANINGRINEFGVLRTIGYKRSHLSRILINEALMISFGGGVIGYIIGMIAPKFIAPFFSITVSGFQFNPLSLLVILVFSICGAMFSLIYPLWRVINFEPLKAISYV